MTGDAPDDSQSQTELLCHRCGAILTPGSTGKGSFYVVRIEAVADPSPPDLSVTESLEHIQRDIDALIDELHEHSERELMDMVYRRLTITLCTPCYQKWIENPVG